MRSSGRVCIRRHAYSALWLSGCVAAGRCRWPVPNGFYPSRCCRRGKTGCNGLPDFLQWIWRRRRPCGCLCLPLGWQKCSRETGWYGHNAHHAVLQCGPGWFLLPWVCVPADLPPILQAGFSSVRPECLARFVLVLQVIWPVSPSLR